LNDQRQNAARSGRGGDEGGATTERRSFHPTLAKPRYKSTRRSF
jgi:hypothetical protein